MVVETSTNQAALGIEFRAGKFEKRPKFLAFHLLHHPLEHKLSLFIILEKAERLRQEALSIDSTLSFSIRALAWVAKFGPIIGVELKLAFQRNLLHIRNRLPTLCS